jgi:hypothetical protein
MYRTFSLVSIDPADAPKTVADGRLLRERIDQLTDARDRLWAQIVCLQDHIRVLERAGQDERMRIFALPARLG